VEHTLECECGRKLTVPEAAAGAREECSCGRTLVIPSLHELRRWAGLPEPTLAPELVIETLLLAGRLPKDVHCVLCGTATRETITCRTECAKARPIPEGSVWTFNVAPDSGYGVACRYDFVTVGMLTLAPAFEDWRMSVVRIPVF